MADVVIPPYVALGAWNWTIAVRIFTIFSIVFDAAEVTVPGER